jgi:hypothetical protein
VSTNTVPTVVDDGNDAFPPNTFPQQELTLKLENVVVNVGVGVGVGVDVLVGVKVGVKVGVDVLVGVKVGVGQT